MRVKPIKGPEPQPVEWDERLSDADTVDEIRQVAGISKGLSPDFGSKQKRRKRLVRNLKRRRSYAKPVKGGTGKQARTRRNRFK